MRSMILRLFGPLVVKELTKISRQITTYAMRFLIGLAVSLFLWLGVGFRSDVTDTPIRTAAKIGSQIVFVVLPIQFAVVVLFVPALVANLVTGERERGTFDLVLMTPLSSREILLGLFLGRLLGIGSLLLVSFGFMAMAVTFYSGVGWDFLIRAIAATVSALIAVSAVATFFSVNSKSTLSTILTTYSVCVIVFAIVPVCLSALFVDDRLEILSLVLSPAYLFLHCLFSDVPQIAGSFRLDDIFWGVVAAQLSGSLVLIGIATYRLRRYGQSKERNIGRKSIGSQVLAPVRWIGRFLSWRRRVDSKSQPTEWWDRVNPLWLRARLGHPWDRESSLLRLQIILAIVYLGYVGVLLANGLPIPRAVDAFVFVPFAVRLVGIIAISGSLPVDAKRGFLDQMLVTPLRGHQFVDGVFWGSLEHLYYLLGTYLLLSFGMFWLFRPDMIWLLIWVLVSLHSVLMYQIAILFACLSRSTLLTLVCSVASLVVAHYVSIVAIYVIADILGGVRFEMFACVPVGAASFAFGFLLLYCPKSLWALFLGINCLWLTGISLVSIMTYMLLPDSTYLRSTVWLAYPWYWDYELCSSLRWASSMRGSADQSYWYILVLNCLFVAVGIGLVRWYTIRQFDTWVGRVVQLRGIGERLKLEW